MAKDRIVANVAGVNGGKDLRPDCCVKSLIFFNSLRFYTDNLPKTAYSVGYLLTQDGAGATPASARVGAAGRSRNPSSAPANPSIQPMMVSQ